jgi:hypothetical protein
MSRIGRLGGQAHAPEHMAEIGAQGRPGQAREAGPGRCAVITIVVIIVCALLLASASLGVPWLAGVLSLAGKPEETLQDGSSTRDILEALERAFEAHTLVYLPELVRAGKLGPPEGALACLRQLFARKVIIARALKLSAVPMSDRRYCLPGPHGTLIAVALRATPDEQPDEQPDEERSTPTSISRRKAS